MEEEKSWIRPETRRSTGIARAEPTDSRRSPGNLPACQWREISPALSTRAERSLTFELEFCGTDTPVCAPGNSGTSIPACRSAVGFRLAMVCCKFPQLRMICALCMPWFHSTSEPLRPRHRGLSVSPFQSAGGATDDSPARQGWDTSQPFPKRRRCDTHPEYRVTNHKSPQLSDTPCRVIFTVTH
jgi:hypothetical protein